MASRGASPTTTPAPATTRKRCRRPPATTRPASRPNRRPTLPPPPPPPPPPDPAPRPPHLPPHPPPPTPPPPPPPTTHAPRRPGPRPRRPVHRPRGPARRSAAPRWLGRPVWGWQRRRHQRQPAGRRRFGPRPAPGGRQPERQTDPRQQRAHSRTGAQRCPRQPAQGHGDADRADLIQGRLGRRPQHRELQPVRRPRARRQWLLGQEQHRHLGEPGQRTV